MCCEGERRHGRRKTVVTKQGRVGRQTCHTCCGIIIIIIIVSLYVMGVLPACTSVYHVHNSHRDQQWVLLDSLELEFSALL